MRAVWDGDQVLHEISARPTGSAMEQDVPSLLDSFMGARHYGGVMHVHGGALDHPVTVVRTEYSDSLPGPGAALIFPLANHKGQYDMGVGAGHCAVIQGRSYRLAEPIGEPRVGSDTAIDMRDFTDPMSYCVEVDWPGKKSFSTGYRRPTWGNAAPWMGSLLYHGRDPSALMYRRNRFYDPQTGRFTQEDPIGIAGGLNVYGYAGGDPFTYRDPFGLDKIYQDRYGREVHRIEQDGPDEHYLRYDGKSYRLDRALVEGRTPYEIHLTGADETAMHLANSAPRHRRVIAGFRSCPAIAWTSRLKPR